MSIRFASPLTNLVQERTEGVEADGWSTAESRRVTGKNEKKTDQIDREIVVPGCAEIFRTSYLGIMIGSVAGIRK